MYCSWLDRWDEQRALRGEIGKTRSEFVLDADCAFPSAAHTAGLDEFCILAEQAVADPSFFDEPNGSSDGFSRQDEWLEFPSDMLTDVEQNNIVWAKITESGSFNQVLVVFHHWNASSWNGLLARFFSRCGITVVEIAMPYHFQRSRPGSQHSDFMLSANLGRTIQSVRQAVWDGRKLIRWLKGEGYQKISVLGLSLGSWVAGLVAAHDAAVTKASLFLTGGSLADMVWTGRATRLIRESLASNLELVDMRRAWGPLDLENYVHSLSRRGLELQVVLASRDKVVLPKISQRFMHTLKAAGAKPDMLVFNCGHYSLAKPPYILLAGWSLKRFLSSPSLQLVDKNDKLK